MQIFSFSYRLVCFQQDDLFQSRAHTRPRPPNACPNASQPTKNVPTRVSSEEKAKKNHPSGHTRPWTRLLAPHACPHAFLRNILGFLCQKAQKDRNKKKETRLEE